MTWSRALRWFAGYGIGEASDAPALSADVVDEARAERLLGVVAGAVARGDVRGEGSVVASLAATHADVLRRALDIEAAALFALESLAHRGIDARLLKGMAVAHLDEPDPSWRTFRDADLIVHPSRFDEAVDALTRSGAVRDLPPRRPGFDRRFGKDVTLRLDAVEVDLHRTIAPGPYGLRVDLDDLWSRSDRFVLGGRDVAALAKPDRLVHALLTLLLGDHRPRLVAARDAALLAERVALDDLDGLADRWRVAAPLASAVRIANDAIGLPAPLVDWARGHRTSGRDRVLLRAYPTGGGTNATTLLSSVAVLPPRSAVDYLAALVAPSVSYRQARRDRGRVPEGRGAFREVAEALARRRSARRDDV